MKLLFISDFILAETQGAKYLSQAHYYSLKSIFGQENVDIVALNSSFGCDDIHYVYIEKKVAKICKFTNILMGMPFLLRRKGYKKILSLLKEKHYDYIFVDHSIYGVLIKKIKTKFKVPVFTFFHGIIKYQNSEYKKNNKTSIFFPLIQYNINKNEKLSVKYSDKCILLNERDEINLIKYYNKKADYFLPVYFLDTEIKIEQKERKSKEFDLLFVGGYFWPNINGIKWFVEKVMPYLPNDIKLYIVGNGMEKLRDWITDQNVNVIGRVDSLDFWYNNADLVVGPIFQGEGMKSKTCEALMYGKKYLGTSEAICGYAELKDYQCNTATEFIDKIIIAYNTQQKKYFKEMRDLYLQNYSPIMAEKILRQIFNFSDSI